MLDWRCRLVLSEVFWRNQWIRNRSEQVLEALKLAAPHLQNGNCGLVVARLRGKIPLIMELAPHLAIVCRVRIGEHDEPHFLFQDSSGGNLVPIDPTDANYGGRWEMDAFLFGPLTECLDGANVLNVDTCRDRGVTIATQKNKDDGPEDLNCQGKALVLFLCDGGAYRSNCLRVLIDKETGEFEMRETSFRTSYAAWWGTKTLAFDPEVAAAYASQ